MVDHFDLAMQVGAEIFSIRHVCEFRAQPSDGLIPVDDLYPAAELDPLPSAERRARAAPGPGAHLAAITGT